MSEKIFGININIPGIEVAIVDIADKSIVSGFVSETVDSNESAENLVETWASTIEKCAGYNSMEISNLGIGLPGPFDYENGISLMTNQQKFESLYRLNVKELLATRLEISPCNIRMDNNTPCFLRGELLAGAAKGFKNVLAFTLNHGLGSARFVNNKVEDGYLWDKPFRDGIAEDYLGIQWISRRYKEFTGEDIVDLRELTTKARTDDGIGQLVFNEYGENFVKFLVQYIPDYDPDLLIIGGHNNAWDLFIPHVKDRLMEKSINLPIRPAILGDAATLIGAADLWSAKPI